MPPKRAAAAGAMKGSRPPLVQHSGVKRPAVQSDTESDSEYRQRRERNNVAVKKSRAKSRARAQMTTAKVEELRQENVELEGKINILSKELDLLKDLLVLRAAKKRDNDGDDVVPSLSDSAAGSHTATADPDLIEQDHGYVSPIKRIRKRR